MRIIGILLVGLGILDLILFYGFETDLTYDLLGEFSTYSPYAFMAIGGILMNLNGDDENTEYPDDNEVEDFGDTDFDFDLDD